MGRVHKVIFGFFVLLIVFALADKFVADRHLPWKSLNMEAPIGLVTGTKITMMALAPSRVCLAKLEQASKLVFTMAPSKSDGAICGWNSAPTTAKIRDIDLRGADVTMQCSLMMGAYIWLGEVDRFARKHLGSGIEKVHHAGTYSCRRQRGNNSGAWSEHAFANAWDVTGFALNDGRVISVLKDWEAGSTKESKNRAKFLRGARSSACRVFRVVLTPDFNDAHKDHFHLDQGPSLSCQ